MFFLSMPLTIVVITVKLPHEMGRLEAGLMGSWGSAHVGTKEEIW